MACLRLLIGFAFAGGIGVLLYFGWFWVHRDIRGTVLQDFQIVSGLVFVFAVLWIADKIWDLLNGWLGGSGE